MPSKRPVSDDEDHDEDLDDDQDMIDGDQSGSPQAKRKKYVVWTPEMVSVLVQALIIITQKKDLSSGGGKLTPKGWKTLENEVQKHFPDIDVHACKTKYKGLRKGYEAIIWCDMQQEKAASEGNGRFRGETYSEFFERQTAKPKGWKTFSKAALQCEPYIEMVRQLFAAIDSESEAMRVMQQQHQQQHQQQLQHQQQQLQQLQQQQLQQLQQQQLQQMQQMPHPHQHLTSERIDVGLLDHVDERMQLAHQHAQVDDRRSQAVQLSVPMEALHPRGLVTMSNLVLPNTPRLTDQHARRPASTDRRSDELISVFREFNDIMRENNATIKTLLSRLIDLCPE